MLTIFLAGLRCGLRFGLRCHADRCHRPLCCRPAKIREEAAVAEKESLQQELEQVQEALAKEKKQCDDRIKEEQAKIE